MFDAAHLGVGRMPFAHEKETLVVLRKQLGMAVRFCNFHLLPQQVCNLKIGCGTFRSEFR